MSVKMDFRSEDLEKMESLVTVFPTQIVMLQPVSYVSEDGLQIRGFGEDGKPCYEGKSLLLLLLCSIKQLNQYSQKILFLLGKKTVK